MHKLDYFAVITCWHNICSPSLPRLPFHQQNNSKDYTSLLKKRYHTCENTQKKAVRESHTLWDVCNDTHMMQPRKKRILPHWSRLDLFDEITPRFIWWDDICNLLACFRTYCKPVSMLRPSPCLWAHRLTTWNLKMQDPSNLDYLSDAALNTENTVERNRFAVTCGCQPAPRLSDVCPAGPCYDFPGYPVCYCPSQHPGTGSQSESQWHLVRAPSHRLWHNLQLETYNQLSSGSVLSSLFVVCLAMSDISVPMLAMHTTCGLSNGWWESCGSLWFQLRLAAMVSMEHSWIINTKIIQSFIGMLYVLTSAVWNEHRIHRFVLNHTAIIDSYWIIQPYSRTWKKPWLWLHLTCILE